jgi:hypothetical protein
MDRPNYFELLGLDPAETEPARIEAAIRDRQAEWSRLRVQHPTRGLEAKQNLERLPDIRAVMLDPTRRQAEAEQASPLDPSRVARLNEHLRLAGHDDLYDFLGCPPEAPLKDLRSRALEIAADLQRPGLKDARQLARSALAGECMALFANEVMRHRYDRSRAPSAARLAEPETKGGPPPPLVLTWQLRRRGWWRRRTLAAITCEGDTDGLCWLGIVGQVNQWPGGLEDGRVLAEWRRTGSPLADKLLLPLAPWPGARGEVFCRLFTDPKGVTVIGPLDAEGARL